MTLSIEAHWPLVASHERHHGHEGQRGDPARHQPAGAFPPLRQVGRFGRALEDPGGRRRRYEGPKRLGHLTGGPESVRWGAGQRALDDVVHFGRHPGPGDSDRRRRGTDPLRHDGLRAGPRERRLTGKHLIEHAAERVDVASGVELALPRRLLRAHVRAGCRR